ncbi:MAG TPA: helix-turn-helix transcriptional regulator [Solirubrobacteraceae bacterium]|nr:helix-turn-helix transcriptional regulator [Solirubrobacteraceae bacterium]
MTAAMTKASVLRCGFRYHKAMRSGDLLVAGRRRAGLSQRQLAERLGRPQSTIARWETGHQQPSLESVLDALHACDLELMVGLARYDDSYESQIARQLLLDPGERLASMAPEWAAPGFDPLGILSELAGQARFVVIGDVAGALHGWPISLGRRVLEIVPAESAMGRVQSVARRLGAEPAVEQPEGSSLWVAPSGAELLATTAPGGTRGYRDLARDAQRMEIAPGVSVRVASLIDLIRIGESSGARARTFLPALWATLQMRQLQAESEAA